MHNESKAAETEQVSREQVEAICKLAYNGIPPDTISSCFNLSTQMVQQVIANDPRHRARVVELIKEKSRKFRCSQSNRLMISPVLAIGNYYEQGILEAHPSLSNERALPNPILKAEIAEFSKESLKMLEEYLRQKDLQDDILELIAECLSVQNHDEDMETALRVLGAVEGQTVWKLIGRLRGLVPEEMLFSLINRTARELPLHALCLAALIILEPHSERSLEDAFNSFTRLLSQADLGTEAIDLAEAVSERLNSSQLYLMNAVLAARPWEVGDRLEGLRLREACALLREGEAEAAHSLVITLQLSPRLEKEVAKFYEAGLSSGSVPILEQRLRAKLEEISQESPSLTEAFSIFHQLLKAELHSHKPAAADQSLISLRTEVEALTVEFVKAGQTVTQTQLAQDAQIQRSETATQESLNSLRRELRALHKHAVRSGKEAKQIQSFIEQARNAEAATQEVLMSLTREAMTLRTDLAQVANQCKMAQSGQEATLQGFAAKSQLAEAAAERLMGTIGALTEEHLKAQKLNRDLAESNLLLQDTREALNQLKTEDFQAQKLHEDTLPAFIYSYKFNTDELHRTHLVTGKQSRHRVPSYLFKEGSCWSELPGGNLLITGGSFPVVSEVVRIDVGTFEVSALHPMHTPRRCHAAVYHTHHLYVLGGYNSRWLSECERYVCAENRWQPLPPLPRACRDTSGVVVESSLYALGGADRSLLDLVQRLSLESFTWELMQLRLPHASAGMPCFKLRDTEVYLVVNKTLYSFTALQVLPIRTLIEDIKSWGGRSYYRRGTLYCSNVDGVVRRHEIL